MLDVIGRDFDEVWRKINEAFLNTKGERPEDATRALMCYSYNNMVVMKGVPRITLDAGMLIAYSKQKWSHLLRSYMDWEQWERLKERTHFRFQRGSEDHTIPLGYTFKYKPKSINGSCVLSFSFLIDKKRSQIQITTHSRTAEVTRRMMFDFILFYKMWKELFPKAMWDNYEWNIQMFYEMMYQSAMFVPVLHTSFDFEKMGISTKGRKHKGFIGRVEKELEVCFSKESRGSGFAQMAKIRDLIAADMRGEDRPSLPIDNFKLEPVASDKESRKIIEDTREQLKFERENKKGCYK